MLSPANSVTRISGSGSPNGPGLATLPSPIQEIVTEAEGSDFTNVAMLGGTDKRVQWPPKSVFGLLI